jgi:hypothetical protein
MDHALLLTNLENLHDRLTRLESGFDLEAPWYTKSIPHLRGAGNEQQMKVPIFSGTDVSQNTHNLYKFIYRLHNIVKPDFSDLKDKIFTTLDRYNYKMDDKPTAYNMDLLKFNFKHGATHFGPAYNQKVISILNQYEPFRANRPGLYIRR